MAEPSHQSEVTAGVSQRQSLLQKFRGDDRDSRSGLQPTFHHCLTCSTSCLNCASSLDILCASVKLFDADSGGLTGAGRYVDLSESILKTRPPCSSDATMTGSMSEGKQDDITRQKKLIFAIESFLGLVPLARKWGQAVAGRPRPPPTLAFSRQSQRGESKRTIRCPTRSS